MSKNKPAPLAGVILFVLSVVLVVGIRTFAGPCGVHDDGSLGACHWAAQAVFAVGIAACILSLVRVFELDEGERRGLSLGVATLGALASLMPVVIIDLCPIASMRCNTVMLPFVAVVGAAIAIVGVVDVIVRLLRLRKPRS